MDKPKLLIVREKDGKFYQTESVIFLNLGSHVNFTDFITKKDVKLRTTRLTSIKPYTP